MHTRPLPSWIWPVVAMLVAVGVLVRFSHLGSMPIWLDEALTLTYLSGHSRAEVEVLFKDKPGFSIADLAAYQRLSPHRRLADTASALAAEDPKHPPLYFVALGVWARIFGDSIAVVRAFSALLGVLLLPAAYWLSMELFGSRHTALTTVGLVAIAPIHVLYAQEARQYSFWTLVIVLSSATLLRALRGRDPRWWVAYAASVGLGLAVHTLFAMTLAAHALYVGAQSLQWKPFGKLILTPPPRGYLVATAIGLGSFAPWAIVMLSHGTSSPGWVRVSAAPAYLVGAFVRGLVSPYFDVMPFGPEASTAGVLSLFTSPFSALVVAISGVLACFAVYCLYRLCRETPAGIWWFVVAPVAVTLAVMVLPDLLVGGRRMTVIRYFLPLLIGIELAVAHILATRVWSSETRWRWGWRAVATGILATGLVSCATIYQTDTWWTKGGSRVNHHTAALLNGFSDPLLIARLIGTMPEILALSHVVHAQTHVRPIRNDEVPELTGGHDAIFFFAGQDDRSPTRRLFEETYRLERVTVDDRLWQIVGRR